MMRLAKPWIWDGSVVGQGQKKSVDSVGGDKGGQCFDLIIVRDAEGGPSYVDHAPNVSWGSAGAGRRVVDDSMAAENLLGADSSH